MTVCYLCGNYVNSENNIPTLLYFCSSFCLDYCLNNHRIYNRIRNYQHMVSNKQCFKCKKEIEKNTVTFHYNDNMYCSENCRKVHMVYKN